MWRKSRRLRPRRRSDESPKIGTAMDDELHRNVAKAIMDALWREAGFDAVKKISASALGNAADAAIRTVQAAPK